MNDPPPTRPVKPRHIDVQRDRGIDITWSDGSASFFSVAQLRGASPSAEHKQWQDQQRDNPLAVMPAKLAGASGKALRILSVQQVGNYALRPVFSDGHDTGIFTWSYLRELDARRGDAGGV
jgi:DUF971 family protein